MQGRNQVHLKDRPVSELVSVSVSAPVLVSTLVSAQA